jgi:PAS domain S-box-containing protein
LADESAIHERCDPDDSLGLAKDSAPRALALLRAALNAATDGLLVIDAEGRTVLSNERFREMWSIPPALLEAGKEADLPRFLSAQCVEPKRFLARFREIQASTAPESSDRVELVDGRVLEQGSRLRSTEEGEAVRVWSYRNVTARKRFEEALQRQSEWLRTTLASIGDGLLITDAEGRLTFFNAAAESLTGWSQAEALGQPLEQRFATLDWWTGEPVSYLTALAAEDQGSTTQSLQLLLIARDGSERPIDATPSAVRDAAGASLGAIIVFRDVSERASSEETKRRLAAIVESSQDAVISKNRDGVILSWNDEAERLFGYSSQEAVGRPITLIIPPDRLDEEREIMERLWRGERVEHFETVRVTKDGRRIDLSLTISPVRDSRGRIVGASKVARDIGDRKRAEAALREADVRKDAFLALLAHELRNPLAPILNGMHILRLAGDDTKAVAQASGMMERQLGLLVRIVDDLLDVSRISQDKLELRRSRVLLEDVISSAVETARPALEAAGHELILSCPSQPLHIDADLTRLAQVLSNLLNNSAKYTPPGGKVWLTAEARRSDLVISVRDNGIGIPKESLPRIFDMFSQVGRRIDRTTGGLGIGLALVKGLVEMHGGTVRAESEGSGQGSTFTLRLPVLVRTEDEGLPELPESEVAGGHARRRILVVDDNRDSAHSLSILLKVLGNDVQTAYDGVEAVEAAARFKPQVVLMDIGMPRANGYEATERIRAQPWGRDMVILAVTGWGQPGDKARSLAAGCDAHMVKPIQVSDLERVLLELPPRGSSSKS